MTDICEIQGQVEGCVRVLACPLIYRFCNDLSRKFFHFLFAHFQDSFYLAPTNDKNTMTMRRMNKVFLFMLFIVGLLTMSACSPKMAPVNTLRRLSTNMETKGEMYSLQDWNKAKNKYVKANQKIMKHRSDYTTAELAEIATLQAKCITGFGKGVTMSAARGVAGVTTGVKSVIDEIKELIDAFGKKKESDN